MENLTHYVIYRPNEHTTALSRRHADWLETEVRDPVWIVVRYIGVYRRGDNLIDVILFSSNFRVELIRKKDIS